MAFLTGSLWIDDFRGMISRKKHKTTVILELETPFEGAP